MTGAFPLVMREGRSQPRPRKEEDLKVYVPLYERGTRGFYQIETEEATYHRTPGHSGYIIFYGMVLNGDDIFTHPDGVQAYFNRSWEGQKKYRFPAEKLKWRLYHAAPLQTDRR